MTDPHDDAPDPAAGETPVDPPAVAPASGEPAASETPAAASFQFPSFDGGSSSLIASDLAMLDDVNLRVSVELGRTRMFVEDVLKLVPEAVIELDKAAGDPVDVFVNGRHVARGEVLVLNENFCVRINEIIPVSDEDD